QADNSYQFFSKICGEKSGGETQTPYYVAIAASFSQIYSSGDTVRLIMFDEAFDKMDDERIASMMEFFKQLKLQVILATPPAKMDVIGERVDTILLAERQGTSSVVERFDFGEQFGKL
ncbi:cell division protein MukB, partial [bacterium]|nr:cell division protein MukB [bacterium]